MRAPDDETPAGTADDGWTPDSVATGSIGAIPVPAEPTTTYRRWPGILALIIHPPISQSGAALAAIAMTSIGPPGVVAIRQLVAAAVLLPIARPRFWRFSRRTLGLVALLGLATAVMNLGLYGAIDRLGLALAVTLEFLGPLFVAVAGARRVRDFVAAALAAVGVLVLVGPGGTTDWLGVGFGLAGAAGWASYIYLNRSVGAAVPGFQGPALSASLGAVLTVPFLIVAAVEGRVTPLALLLAAVAGVCCSVVPMAADVFALRRIPPRVFGVMATLNPVAAAVAAVVILHQAPTVTEWVGIAVIATANVAATIDVRRRRARPSSEEAAA